MKKAAKIISIFFCICIASYIISPIDESFTKLYSKYKGYGTYAQTDVLDDMYWYNNLTENEKKAYRSIYAAILDFPEKIAITKINGKELENIFMALSYDNPNFFFLGNSSTLERSGYAYFFVPQYTMTKPVYNEYLLKLNGALEQISLNTVGMSDYEKELYVHDFIVNKCVYNDTGSDIRCTAYGAIINNQANCEGYSRGMQFLLNGLGVRCRVIIGEASDSLGKIEGHMWNVVTIDGKEYNLDGTWDDHELKGAPFNSKPLSHMFMNIPTSEIISTHTALDKKYNEGCVYNDANYYKISNILFTDYDNDTKNKIVDEIVKQIADGGNNIEIKFDNKQAYDTAVNKLFKGQDIYRLISRANLSLSKKIDSKNISYINISEKQIIRVFFKL